jgi:flagellar assembly protein FliH
MKTPRTTVLRGVAADKVQPVAFPSFDRRPVNYFREFVADDELDANSPRADIASTAQTEEALRTERERWEVEHRQAAEERFQAGLQQGREESAAEFKRALELLQEYARLLQAEKQELAGRMEKNSVELAFALARKIIDTELSVRPEAVVDVARAAVRQVLDSNQVRLTVNGEDLSYLRHVREELAQMLDASAQLEIHADSKVERGGCMIETERGLLDARVSSQLETLKTELAGLKPKSDAP